MSGFVAGSPVFAQIRSYGSSNVTVESLVDTVVAKSWIVFAAVAVICFLVSGIMFLTAEGDAAKIKTARSSFIWGIAGVVVGIISYSIISIVGNAI